MTRPSGGTGEPSEALKINTRRAPPPPAPATNVSFIGEYAINDGINDMFMLHSADALGNSTKIDYENQIKREKTRTSISVRHVCAALRFGCADMTGKGHRDTHRRADARSGRCAQPGRDTHS